MKKTIFLGLLFLSGIAAPAFATNVIKPLPVKEIKTEGYTTVVINANVTVYLVNTKDDIVKMNGDDFFMQHVSIKREGNNLIINASKNRDFKKKGVIYVPAATINHIQINSSAVVRSANNLQIPLLNVLINGSCRVSIVNNGEVKLTRGPSYDYDYEIKRRSPVVNGEK